MFLWFGDDHKRSQWSSFSKIEIISAKLSQYRYPSTTSRTPRSLKQFHRFKANEFRLILLFGAPVFRRYLDQLHYENYLLLVFACHLAESRSIHQEDIDEIDFLLGKLDFFRRRIETYRCLMSVSDTFLKEYPILYTNRHNQQVIHSLSHVSQSVRDYGQLSNYSTFNFESVLGEKKVMFRLYLHMSFIAGMLRSTVHSTKNQAEEIANNMNLLRLAVQHSLSNEFSGILKQILDEMQTAQIIDDNSATVIRSKEKTVKLGSREIIEENQYRQLQELFQRDDIKVFKTVFLNGTRFSTRDFAKGKKNDDSCILYKLKEKSNVGFIDRIVQVDQKIYFRIRKVNIKEDLNCSWNNKTFHCRNISLGKLHNEEPELFIKIDDVIEKLVHYQETTNSFFFFRFPTLRESS